MVFSKSEEEHVTHVSTVLSRLRANNLFAKASKCLFHVSSVEYLFYVVSSEGLKMDQAKVQQILNWLPPRNLKALQSSLGFVNFYQRFIKNYSKKISSLTSFLKKDSCFLSMRKLLVSDSGKHPIAFNSCKLIQAEFNYEIHDKELLGIVWALKRWRAFLLSLYSPFEVLTYYSSLQYFMTSKVLTRCQAHWAEFLSEIHFSITYGPGRLATLLDSLSRWDNIYPESGEDFISKNPMNLPKIIKQDEFQPSKFFAVKVESLSNLIDSSRRNCGKILSTEVSLKIWVKRNNSPLAGHPGQEKTLKLIKRDFHWPSMTQFIKDYVSSCQQCSRNKNIHHKKFGFLKPLPIPNGPWICLSMDFITQLPLSNSFDSILVIVDRFSKMAVFIPTMSSITSLDLAHLFIKNIFSKHGLPSSIVSDRETDGQTERVNQILEQYLWMYVSYHQDDWNTWLPLAEFAYNNSDHSSTKQSPFFTVYGRDPQFDSVHITQDTPAGKLSTKIQSVQQDVKRELEAAINRFKRYADKGRASPPVSILVTCQFSCLPPQWKSIHPVFHISLLEPVKTSAIPNWHQEPPPPIIIEEEEEWEVSQILDSKLKRGKLWYLVEWKGFSQDPERSIWEPAKNLKNCPKLVNDFLSLYPDKPGPNFSKA
ncbi:hypothetical protein O181_077658 [Austropuccinia psidii MF-1]|uniref:Chromo domain-containing protein n=1 Tax=Austropuccinia psidii MF-1 TaxID=1389203 RepID=A0A9Q3FHD5_9BASI|nr:hypothetical protein [Austropuccinia psidii MF-1]